MAFVWCPHSCQFLLYLVELDSHTASCSPRFPSGSWDQKHGWLLFCLEMPAWEKAGRSGNPGWECGVAWGPVPPHSCTREGRLSCCNNTATAGCVDFPVSGSITFPFCLFSALLRSVILLITLVIRACRPAVCSVEVPTVHTHNPSHLPSLGTVTFSSCPLVKNNFIYHVD